MFLSPGPSIDAFLTSISRGIPVSLHILDVLIDGISFVDLACTASSLSISLLKEGDQNCMAYSKWGLTNALYRVNIVSLLLVLNCRLM